MDRTIKLIIDAIIIIGIILFVENNHENWAVVFVFLLFMNREKDAKEN